MKALVLKANKRLSYSEINNPKIGPRECLVRIMAAGVCASDLPRAFEGKAYHYPLVMGHEMSGVVEQCGSRVRRITKGDRVVVYPLIPCQTCVSCRSGQFNLCRDYDYYGSRRDGGFAARLVVQEWNLMKLPSSVDFETGALIEPSSVAWRAVQKTQPQRKNRVAILGGGFIGLMALQFLKKVFHCREVVVFDRNLFKLRLARSLGAKTALLPKGATKHMDSFDVVLETCGAPATYELSLKLAGRNGRIVWVGNPSGVLKLDEKTISAALRREQTLATTWNSVYHPFKPSDWSAVTRLFAKKAVYPLRLVSHRAPLFEGAKLLKDMHSQKIRKTPHSYLKALLQPASKPLRRTEEMAS